MCKLFGKWRVHLSLLALAAVFFWRLWLDPGGFFYRPNSDYSDLTITHWPNAFFIRHSLSAWGQIPLWRHLILGGEPFAANSLSGLWYPPNVVLLILPLTFAFNVLFVLHTAWAGWGAYRLARSIGASWAGGLLAAFTVMLTPKAVAHLAAGHVGLTFAWAWLPWLLWAVRRLARRNHLGDVAIAAAIAAMLALADVRLGFYAGLAAAGYWVVNLKFQISNLKWRIPAAVGAFLLAGALVAVQVVPLAMVAGRLNRGGLSLEDSSVFSLPPRYLLGLLVADHGGFHEWMTYLGAVGLLLAWVGLACWRGKERWWWSGLALLVVVYSLGTYTPFYGILYRLLPPLRWLRGPARAWFLAALAVAVLAAKGLTALEEVRPRARSGFLRLTAVGLVGAALAGVGGGLVLRLPANVVIAAGLWPLVGALVALRLSGRLRTPLFTCLILALTLSDLWLVGLTLYRVRPAEDVLAEGQAVAEWLDRQARPFRVYSPSYSIPHHTGALYDIESVDGVDPFQLADYAAFMRAAAGVDTFGYSVTVPPFPQGDGGEDGLLSLRGVKPDLERLGLLNVRYVAAAYPMEMDGLTSLGEWDGVYVYQNELALPRVFVRDEGAETREASLVEWTPNRIVVEAQGPGLLVLSEVYDPDWRAWVDGQVTEVVRVEQVLRGVHLKAGEHRVVFSYWPAGLTIGVASTAVGWVCAVGVWLFSRAIPAPPDRTKRGLE